ncbi:Tether containing UBX domain for GLUT4 [Desmophyllum pertusum]|uniref:Tether containing UBX domain for GLUT4 n=1 Tax=Desmophyllum pertusum TaxID=174260 RepID=A0A9W9YPW1_9CNID|nr:Tether containing UBX domain for GLUT4 [Desmophyllum pertusum]
MAACKSVVCSLSKCTSTNRESKSDRALFFRYFNVIFTCLLSLVKLHKVVLEEVCSKQVLSSECYALQHQRKILDDTLPIRYSGLSNNAHLELVASPKSKKVQSSATVGLQLESGERLVKEFPSSSSLWDVLYHWDSDQDSPHQGKIMNPSPEEQKSPVCVYLTQEIKGESSLRGATLHSLGLTGKRAVIRLIHRQLRETVEAAEAVEILPTEEGQSRISDLVPVVDDQITSEQRTINKPVVSSATSSSIKTTSQESANEVQKNVSIDAVTAKMTSKDTHIQESAKEPKTKRPRINPPKSPFANFKFPEKTAGMDIFQREKADSSRREYLATPCDRHPVVFSEEDPSSPKPDGGEIPDSFFEVTVDDIRVMLRDLKNERKQADSAPLMTRAMREVREESEMYKHDKLCESSFLTDWFLQAFFRPMEKEQTIPASVIHFGSQEQQEHFLARRLLDQLSTVFDAEKAVIDTGVLSVRSSSRPDIGDSLVSSSTVDEPGTSSDGADRSHEGLNPDSSSRPRTGGASKGAVPKWFKGTGK